MRSAVALLAVLAVGGCTSSVLSLPAQCQQCDAGCGRGLATFGLVLTPPGCGSQCARGFCAVCTADSTGCAAQHPLDGGRGTCVASLLTVSKGTLKPGGVAVSQGSTVFLATSASAACALSRDAGASLASTEG